MNEQDQRLAQRLRNAMPDCDAASFADSFSAAEARAGRRRHRTHLLAAAAVAAIAVIVIISQPQAPPGTDGYIEIAELLESTSWSAPSDSLLPDSQFDIYQEMPRLMESTDAYGGALL